MPHQPSMPERISRSVNNDLGKGDSLDASFEDYRIYLFIVSPASPHRRPSGELTRFLLSSTPQHHQSHRLQVEPSPHRRRKVQAFRISQTYRSFWLCSFPFLRCCMPCSLVWYPDFAHEVPKTIWLFTVPRRLVNRRNISQVGEMELPAAANTMEVLIII
jgi:hypothetical protein